jgi:hypothetical protein
MQWHSRLHFFLAFLLAWIGDKLGVSVVGLISVLETSTETIKVVHLFLIAPPILVIEGLAATAIFNRLS